MWQNSIWLIQDGAHLQPTLDMIRIFCFSLLLRLKKIFKFGDGGFLVKDVRLVVEKFKMADPIWRTFFQNSTDFAEFLYIGVFEVTECESDFFFQNTKWRIQNGGLFFKTLQILMNFCTLRFQNRLM